MPDAPLDFSLFQLDSSETFQKEKAWLKVTQARIYDETKPFQNQSNQKVALKLTPEQIHNKAELVVQSTIQFKVMTAS